MEKIGDALQILAALVVIVVAAVGAAVYTVGLERKIDETRAELKTDIGETNRKLDVLTEIVKQSLAQAQDALATQRQH